MRIVLFVGLFLSVAILHAKEMCIPYTQDKTIVASLAVSNNKAIRQTNNFFDRYMKLAKRNDSQAVLNLHTRIDDSYNALNESLKNTPDFYSSYSQIKKVNKGELFEWGNYRLMMSEYFHRSGKAFLTDAFYCSSSSCQLSTLFDDPDEQTYLVSRFIYLFERLSQAPVSCAENGKERFSISPRVNISNKKGLMIYINKPLEQERVNLLANDNLKNLPSNIADCFNQIISLDESEVLSEPFIRRMIKQCTIKMAVDKLIPVLAFGDNIETRYLTAVAYISLVRNLTELTPVLRLNDGERQIIVAVAESSASGKYLLLMPIVEKNNKAYFDWKYFGTAAGEMMVSPYFAQYIKDNI